jgi:hypothetical protein
MLAGGRERADWVRNLRRNPDIAVKIRNTDFSGTARTIDNLDEDKRARTLLVTKYQPRYQGDLTDWSRSSLPIAVDLDLS